MSGLISTVTYESAYNVTVSDTDTDPHVRTCFAGLYVGAAGSVKVTTVGGQDVVFVGVTAGTTLRIACTRVWSTGTTVTTPNTNILGLVQLPYKGKP